jgi:hypothetical protein
MLQMHKSGRLAPSAREFADRSAIRTSLLKRTLSRQTPPSFFLAYLRLFAEKDVPHRIAAGILIGNPSGSTQRTSGKHIPAAYTMRQCQLFRR